MNLSQESIIWIFRQAFVALLYLLFGILIHQFFTHHGIVSIVWPGTGLALGAVLIWGRTCIWGVLIGSFALNLISNDSTWAILGMTLANVAEIWLAGLLLESMVGSINQAASLNQLLRIIFLGGVACMLAASIGSPSLLLAVYINSDELLEQWWHWWRGDFLGIVIFTPLMLSFQKLFFKDTKLWNVIEPFMLLLATVVVGQMVFLDWGATLFDSPPKDYLLFFFINLIAIRSNLWVTCLAILMIAIQGLAGAYLKMGYFRDEIEVSQLDNYWTYMLIISLIGITISSYLNELKTARNEAINRKDEFRSLFSNMTNGFALHQVIRDASGKMVDYRFIDVNPAFEKMTGLPRSRWIGNTVKEVIPETENYWIEHYEKVVDTGEFGVYENFSKPLGRWFSTYAYRPTPEYFAVILQDITLQKEAVAKLSAIEQRWKFALEGAGDGVWDWNVQTNEVFFSQQWKSMLGYSDDEIDNNLEAWKSRVYPDDLPQVYKDLENHFNGETTAYANEHRMRCKDGSYKWIMARGLIIEKSQDGRPLRVIGTHTDISERKKAEAMLSSAAQYARSLIEASLDPLVTINTEGKITDCNLATEAITGLGREALIGSDFSDYFTEPDKAYQAYQQAFARGFIKDYPLAIQHQDSQIKEVLYNASVYRNANGEIEGVFAAARDITESKRNQTLEHYRSQILELLANNATLEDILTQMALGIEHICPKALCSILLLDDDGKHLLNGAAPSLPDFYNTAIHGLAIGLGVGSCGTAAHLGERVVVEDIQNHPYWAPYKALAAKAGLGACWSQPIKDSSEKVMGTFAIYHQHPQTPLESDIKLITQTAHLATIVIEAKRADQELASYRNHLEELVNQRSKQIAILNQELEKRALEAESANAAKSTFLSNMSHEIRSPMNAILGFTHILRSRGDNLTDVQKDHLYKIQQASEHLLAIINDILDLSKIEAGKMQLDVVEFNRAEFFDKISSLVSDRIRAKGLRFSTDINRLPEKMLGDSTRLTQMLLNYLSNAIKFTEQGGIILRAKLLEEQENAVLVRFEVEDSGIGIDQTQLAKLFNPFEQADSSITRRYGGTGLGLVITKHLAELMAGQVGAESSVGHGSIFWFTARLGKIGTTPVVLDNGDTISDGAEAMLGKLHAGKLILVAEDSEINQEVGQDVSSRYPAGTRICE
jgi:PAS domain S-box-containing protein